MNENELIFRWDNRLGLVVSQKNPPEKLLNTYAKTKEPKPKPKTNRKTIKS